MYGMFKDCPRHKDTAPIDVSHMNTYRMIKASSFHREHKDTVLYGIGLLYYFYCTVYQMNDIRHRSYCLFLWAPIQMLTTGKNSVRV